MPLKRTRSITTSVVPLSGKVVKKRRVTVRRRPQLLSAPGTPFPDRCRAVLRYTSYANVDPSILACAIYRLRCNSVFDPDYTSAGGQPRGYDQYALLYNQYTVNKSTLKVWPALPSTGGGGQYLHGISIVPDASVTPAIDQCADRPFTTFNLCNQQSSAKDNGLKMVWDRKKRFPKEDLASSLSAGIGSNPAEEEYFEYWSHGAYQPLTQDPTGYTIQYELIYEVEFYELKQIPAS